MCAAGCEEFCAETGLVVSGRTDNWPLGSATLISQQTTHRGGAHSDPAAPARVVFMLTLAPRPQSGDRTVETRIIGIGGTYSMHWSQYGHTLTDFQNPAVRMRQPWRTLRSLGIYKADQSQWGWDYLTSSSAQIANDDGYFTRYDFDVFMRQGGIWWLPGQLQGSSFREIRSSVVWVFYLLETIKKCQAASALAHRFILAVYTVAVATSAFTLRKRRVGWSSSVAICIIRLVALHAVVLLAAMGTARRVADGQWGRNILAERSFSLPNIVALAPELPATLPTEHDVFILEGMQSEYLGSYTKVLEVAHPGNKVWNDLALNYATGYDRFSSDLQSTARLSMLLNVRQEHGRILVKNNEGNWAEAPDPLAHWFCHKSLRQRSNRYMNSAIQSLDFLLSEARFGYWRDTAMHRRFASKFVVAVRDTILGFRRDDGNSSLGNSAVSVRRTFAVTSPLLAGLPSDTTMSMVSRCRSPPPVRSIQEPYRGAWLQEQDRVEATFEGEANGKI